MLREKQGFEVFEVSRIYINFDGYINMKDLREHGREGRNSEDEKGIVGGRAVEEIGVIR